MARRGIGLLAFGALALFVSAATAQPPRRPGGMEPGTLLPPFVRAELKLTEEQEKEVAQLERHVRDRLNGILTQEQKDQLRAMQVPGRPPRGRMSMPRPGPCPLPILPALPAYNDTTFYAKTNVPHGKVEQATYQNEAGRQKRMHIYLPPDYDKNPDARYPVLYLNHGGGDDDSKWTSTDRRNGGNAQFILDNLIAAGKARPMIVVMPNTRDIASATPSAPGNDDACTREYLKHIIPYVESHYRARSGRANRALAGLSMGGFVVMNTGLPHLDTFSELYVYSSGYFAEQQKAFENNFQGLFKDPKTNDLFHVPFYMAAGETDIALLNAQRTLSVINKYGIRNFWVFSSGGHEWANWRRYLYQTAQVMFPDCPDSERGRQTRAQP